MVAIAKQDTPNIDEVGSLTLTQIEGALPLAEQKLKGMMRATVLAGLEAGALLLRAKELCAHGEFTDWCEEHTSISQPQRSRFMRLASEPDVVLAKLKENPMASIASLIDEGTSSSSDEDALPDRIADRRQASPVLPNEPGDTPAPSEPTLAPIEAEVVDDEGDDLSEDYDDEIDEVEEILADPFWKESVEALRRIEKGIEKRETGDWGPVVQTFATNYRKTLRELSAALKKNSPADVCRKCEGVGLDEHEEACTACRGTGVMNHLTFKQTERA